VDELNNTESVEVEGQPYEGDLSDLVPDEPVEAAPAADFEPEPQAEVAPEPVEHQSFSALDDALGDIEELKHDGFWEKIDADHIRELPPTARRILHNLRVDRKMSQQKHVSEMEELQAAIEQREQRLADMEREFSQRQSEFANLIEDIPLSTQDAYQIVKARRVMAQQQARAAQEQRARQQSARRIGRAVHGGNPSNGEIPPEIKKQGAHAIVQWLQANPEAHKKISQSFR
jgi:hypothetical protein